MIKKIRFIFGDQLNIQHSWFSSCDDECLYLMAEMPSELSYVQHHHQKATAFLAAMRSFADSIQNLGHELLYLDLDHCNNKTKLVDILKEVIESYQPKLLEFQEVDEYRLQGMLENIKEKAKLNVQIVNSEHYFLPREDLPQYFISNKHKKMEFFYRALRKRFDILMCDGKPEGERWNFDNENRKKLSKSDVAELPEPLIFKNEVSDISAMLERHHVATIGGKKSSIDWPVNREQSLQLLDWFCRTCLPHFGRFQDAMSSDSPHSWALYHSRLSFSLNCKMLSPAEVVNSAITHYRTSSDIDIAQVEGFVRQILGWREFVRGIYWANMPNYKQYNFLDANRSLPSFFWDAKVDLRCLNSAIGHALERSYSHHIERLMVIGNYCLLIAANPDEVDDWYLSVYADAIEWVQLPNTRGMSQFADGGLLATKPYVASGAYINRMSDHCRSCKYNVKLASGEGACPKNSLYWSFLDRNRDKFESNHRMAMSYKNWDRKSELDKEAILLSAKSYLEAL
ncbi:MAG: cryptochrome/photolyase family protein [Cellvibrionaceae bacterium]|nr:cryptochrome/photolyase family protein [Cellvibrionaceae bacterium]